MARYHAKEVWEDWKCLLALYGSQLPHTVLCKVRTACIECLAGHWQMAAGAEAGCTQLCPLEGCAGWDHKEE